MVLTALRRSHSLPFVAKSARYVIKRDTGSEIFPIWGFQKGDKNDDGRQRQTIE
jgi:hypothetical protein